VGLLAVVASGLFYSTAPAQSSIWTNPITGTNPNTSDPYTSGQTVANNITVSGIGRGSGITGSNTNDRYNATGWNTASLDTNDYFYFTLTPNNSFKIDFSSFVYTSQASGSGPANFAFRSSLDSYGSNIATPTNAGTTIDLSGASYQGITNAITFRLYGWGASSSSGTFSVNDFTFNGNIGSTTAFTTWTGTGSAGTWSNGTAGQLGGNYANDLTNTVTFTGTGANVTASGPVQAGSLIFNTDSYILGGAVQLGVGSITTTGSITTNITASISGNGSSGLTKAGTGTLILSGSNSYTGTTTLNADIITMGNADALGSNGNITFSGGSLQYGSGITQDISSRIRNSGSAIIVDTNNNNVTFGTALAATNIGGLTKQGTGTLTLSVSNTLTGPLQVTGGTLSLSSGTLTINTASASTISGTLSGSGSLTKQGSGTLTISNNNSGYSGETRLEGGVLEIGDNGALGTGTITFRAANSTFRSTDATDRTLSNAIGQFTGSDGTTYTFGSVGTGNLTFSGTGSTSLTSSGAPARVFNVLNSTTSFAQSFTGASLVTKTGSGTLILAGNNTYTGATTINAGTLQIGNGGTTGALSTSSAITVNGTLAFNRLGDVVQGANFSTAAINGTGSIIQNGSGNLTLNATNAYAGGTTLNSGTLNINNASAIGSGALTLNGGTLNNTSGSDITLSTNNAQNWNSDFAFTGTNNLNLGNGAVTMNASRTVTVNGGNLTVGGSISGSGFGLTKNGTGTLTLSGANTYTGNTTINSGTLTAAAAGAVGNSTQVIVNGGSFLVTADDAIGTNTGINLGTSSTTTPGLVFSGNYSGHVGALTLSADSIIDLGTSSVRLIFASIAGLANYNLSIWNWSGNTQWSGSPGGGTDQLSFTDASGLSGNLSRISFYSDLGQSLISNNAFTVGSNPTEIVAVPEPGLIITAAALLLFLLFRLARQHREANRAEKA
jgi:autotransporter-associated beta strand protein